MLLIFSFVMFLGVSGADSSCQVGEEERWLLSLLLLLFKLNQLIRGESFCWLLFKSSDEYLRVLEDCIGWDNQLREEGMCEEERSRAVDSFTNSSQGMMIQKSLTLAFINTTR